MMENDRYAMRVEGEIFLRGVILPGRERVDVAEFDRPEPGHGQVLVKMKASGLCGSDLRAIYHEPVCSWVCGLHQMGQLLAHLARKGLHPETTVTHTFPLSETKQAYETFDAGKTGEVVISWGEDAAGGHPVR